MTFHVNCLLGWQTIHMKCQDLFSLKNKKKLLSAAVVIDTLRVNSTVPKIKMLTALLVRMCLSVGWENGLELELMTVSFNS